MICGETEQSILIVPRTGELCQWQLLFYFLTRCCRQLTSSFAARFCQPQAGRTLQQKPPACEPPKVGKGGYVEHSRLRIPVPQTGAQTPSGGWCAPDYVPDL